ncbi:MAG TPA: Gfo/Idh/MocA family oxidoreductase [Chloroflexota bacterium]|nr:Gfo/Idh/MocA family oxidoreductase [Chloroflexota bacterium]
MTVQTTPGTPRRVALLGLNARAERLLIPGLLAAGNCTLTALCSRSAEKAAAVAARHGVPHSFGSVEALLASGVADTIFINTPPGAHRAAAVAAAQAGLAVICEKPLADSAAAAKEIADAVAAAGVASAVHFTYRGVAGTRMVARLLEQGAIGRLLLLQTALLQAKELQAGAPGRSALVEIGSHGLDLCRWWLASAGAGADLALEHAASTASAASAADLTVNAVCRSSSGALVTLLVTRAALGFGNGIRALLCGDKGSIELTLDADSVVLQVATAGQPFAPLAVAEDLQVSYTAFPAVQMRALIGSVDGTQQFPTVQAALEVQGLQDAIAQRAGLEPASLASAGR